MTRSIKPTSVSDDDILVDVHSRSVNFTKVAAIPPLTDRIKITGEPMEGETRPEAASNGRSAILQR